MCVCEGGGDECEWDGGEVLAEGEYAAVGYAVFVCLGLYPVSDGFSGTQYMGWR